MSASRVGDLDRKALASAAAARWAEASQALRRGEPGAADPALANHFAQVSQISGLSIATTSDGIGTKVELAERTGVYDTLGFDLMAMVVDDLAAAGATPLSITNILDVDTIDPAVVDDLMRGLFEAARAARVAVSGGEIAELGPRIGGYGAGMHFNWCATAIGWFPPGHPPLSGAALQAGDRLIGLPSPGFRSNGLTLARSLLTERHGEDWHTVDWRGRTWGARLRWPSRIYAPALVDLRAALGPDLHGAAHITGGGIPNKLGRVLRATGLGAQISDPLSPPPEMVELGAGLDPITRWRAWNQGHGMILALAANAADAALAALRDQGHAAAVIGEVVSTPGITIQPAGAPAIRFEATP